MRPSKFRLPLNTDATTTRDFALRSFTVALDSGLGVLDVRGSVANNTLRLHMGSGPDATEQKIPLSEPIYLPSSARAHMRGDLLAAGRSVTLRVFDPSAMQHEPLQIRVLERAPVDQFFARPATPEAAAFIKGELPWA